MGVFSCFNGKQPAKRDVHSAPPALDGNSRRTSSSEVSSGVPEGTLPRAQTPKRRCARAPLLRHFPLRCGSQRCVAHCPLPGCARRTALRTGDHCDYDCSPAGRVISCAEHPRRDCGRRVQRGRGTSATRCQAAWPDTAWTCRCATVDRACAYVRFADTSLRFAVFAGVRRCNH